jgi:tetratricopeptide (TPR) repeat protein
MRFPRALACILGVALAFALLAPAQSDLRQLYAEAQQAQAAGNLAVATGKYEAIVKLQPKMAEACANLGNLYYEQGQIERAKAAYRKAIEQKPELVGPQFLLGVIAFGEHDYSEALDHLGKAAASQPSNPMIYAYLGYTRFARSEFGEATTNLEKAYALNGTDIDVLYHLSKSYGHSADRAFAQLQSEFPGSVYTLLARAHLAEIKEDWADAAKQYGLALEKMPDNQRLREKARWSEAMATTGKATPPADSQKDELVDASVAYKDTPLSAPKLKEEITRWQSKLSGLESIDKDDRRRYWQGEGYQALAYLTSLVVFELDQDSYRAHELRAQMFEESNNDDGAIREYREALKRKPDLQNIHFAIGTLYWKDQHLDNAWAELQMELKTNAHHPQALYELGDICAFTGRTSEAEKYFLQAVKLEPGMADAHYALEKIYTESGRYDKSLEQLQTALKLNASDSTAHYRLAVVYRKLGRPEDAQRELALFDRSKAQTAVAHNGSSTVK